tara:strand:- start:881 stop:1849 length:969 start_codon:yes stop_codon:yes gene_type:complete
MKNLLRKISILFSILFNRYLLKKPDFSEKKIFLKGKQLEDLNKQKNQISDFKEVEFSVFSQFGEDGIISWIIEKIPEIKKVFVEIGTQDYWESNTRFLLKSKNWKGYIIDNSKKSINKIKTQRIYWQHNLKAIEFFVKKENINLLIAKNIKEKNIGLLSIDIDGNDYWVLNEINGLSPAIIVCEFNSIFGDLHKISVPYDENFDRNKAHFSNMYFGASINAFITMLKKKGYKFLGTSSTGINAFFVNDEFKSYFDNCIGENKIYPTLARESLDISGKLTHEDIFKALDKIKNLEVFDFDENKTKKITQYKNLYSKSWLNYFE